MPLEMNAAAIFFLTFAVLLLLCFVFFCLKGTAKTTLKEALDILTSCLKSLGTCKWPSEQQTSSREINHITIRTIGELNQGFYDINFAPPSYDSVVAADKSRDPDLPSYEDALKFICIYDITNIGDDTNTSES